MNASRATSIVSLGRPGDNPLAAPSDARGISPALDDLARAADEAAGNVTASLDLARGVGDEMPTPGDGGTLALWEALATLAATDVTTARVIEPHIDALGILAEARAAGIEVPADVAPADATWGVFAAEGPGVKLEATPDADGGWRLSGTKPWCSLADRLSHALVTAWLPSGERGLFAVPLTRGGVRVQQGVWHAVGLADVASGPVDFDDVPAAPVGDAGWYLRRPGFAWGGIGVAACWFGGAVGVARAVREAASRREPDQIGLMHVGRLESALTTGRLALRDAAELVDARAGLAASDPQLLAGRTRMIIADVVELVLGEAARALGPAPLALDARHARRVADLSLYVRQHHAERDEAAIGKAVLAGGGDW